MVTRLLPRVSMDANLLLERTLMRRYLRLVALIVK